MGDPYLTLGIKELVSDEAVTAAYHRKLRQFPPEEYPQEFAVISEAYEAIRTEEDRLDLRLFGPVPEPGQVSELAEHELPELPNMGRTVWQQVAVTSWLAGRVS
jgi:curved DNA-binding protein CbpA